nr:MAG TPA: hypothetical protein [Caudoviricetes sp.]
MGQARGGGLGVRGQQQRDLDRGAARVHTQPGTSYPVRHGQARG